jgi:hypothetical protein
MRIPFTAPKLPELDELSAERRLIILKHYAASTEARRLLKIFKALLFISIPLLLAPMASWTKPSVALLVTGIFVLINAIVYYRIASRQIILGILKNGLH